MPREWEACYRYMDTVLERNAMITEMMSKGWRLAAVMIHQPQRGTPGHYFELIFQRRKVKA